ncbi:hypothetical protein A4A49_52599 [Nicotiana attenuata]|uniref:Zinc finger GRF-type domain-containing protein n=1 Tax=Nicotiana attenuata TaxID=49451 RepID=A0A1J6JYL8_NICAT|nr:hypothetical protein A4A49_52599 [Nicotiana attenuata]
MSESSTSSRESGQSRTCFCGLTSNQFTATTPMNGGCRLFKCPRPEDIACRYWEWRDEELSAHVSMFIHTQKISLNVIRKERNNLKKTLDEFLGSNASDLKKVTCLEKKVSNLDSNLKRWKNFCCCHGHFLFVL